jgi:hypothetical protein
MITKVTFPKYTPKVGLGANLIRRHDGSLVRRQKPEHIEAAENIVGALRSGDAHAASYEIERLRKLLRPWLRKNPPVVELVNTIDIATATEP